jgi:hypothetical protein
VRGWADASSDAEDVRGGSDTPPAKLFFFLCVCVPECNKTCVRVMKTVWLVNDCEHERASERASGKCVQLRRADGMCTCSYTP